MTVSGRSVGLACCDVAEAAGHRDDVDGGITTTHAYHLIGGDLHAALVEGLEEGDAGDAIGRAGPALHRQTATALATDGPENGVVSPSPIVRW